jgi:hypothetical protein
MARQLSGTRWVVLAASLVAVCALALWCESASASDAAPGWEVDLTSYPANLAPGGTGTVEIGVYNVGAAASTGTVTMTAVLPVGVTATEAGSLEGGEWSCTGTTVVTCTSGLVASGALERIGIQVAVAPGLSGTLSSKVTVSGGGAPSPASTTGQIPVSDAAPSFDFANFDGWFTNADGTVDTQAGSHPYELTLQYHMNTANGPGSVTPAGGETRDVAVNLPPGLVGDPNAAPQCTRQQLDGESCPASTQVGEDRTGLAGFGATPNGHFHFAVYNMVPPPGVPAQFAFTIVGITTFLDSGVRSGGDYGITTHVDNIAQRGIVYNSITLWGVPADARHDAQRCSELNEQKICGQSSSAALKPLLTLPTSCMGPQRFTTTADPWREQGQPNAEASFESHDSAGDPVGITGCDHLGFGPSISVAPDTTEADTPAGLTVELKVPQEGLADPHGIATSNVRNTTVTLPEGVVVNPGQASGLQACQISEDALGPLPDGEEDSDAPSCPAASKVGTVAIETPLLKDKLEGNVYVLQSNPPNLRLLVAASADGVNLKLLGDVHLDEATGRLTTTFTDTPELPFTDFRLAFSGGAQAALATPTGCGVYATTSDFASWGAPLVQDVFPSSSFAIASGPGGSACASPLPFSPVLTAGSTTDQAGGYSAFSLLLQRGDGQQRVSTLRFQTPEGLLGMISKVPLCAEPAAAEGSCPAASQIGHTVVTAGPGPYPLVVPEPGQPAAPIYLTGGYKGAPYGLSIAVPVIAGPFNLGTVVVRASIAVDPHTAQLTVTTDPLPSILDGIPTDLRSINAVIDRPGFIFNPTNCAPRSFSGMATSTEGATAAISSHFQVGSCQSLKFAPDFKVSTSGRTSKANGASLDAKIVYPTGPLGANQASAQANIASVKVDLPKQLPSRLTTLQKACAAAVFAANPAGCPKESVVGHATALTPVLPVALTGPVYFVSHAGEAFPSLIVVLQGYGVTVDLVGTTFINGKTQVTSSTFKQVPDVPISSFDLSLPEGRFSALAANLPVKAKGGFCGQKLTMPTAFTGQNGAVIHQSTNISVTGCPKAKKIKRQGRSGR